jgi:hypothetical protein
MSKKRSGKSSKGPLWSKLERKQLEDESAEVKDKVREVKDRVEVSLLRDGWTRFSRFWESSFGWRDLTARGIVLCLGWLDVIFEMLGWDV